LPPVTWRPAVIFPCTYESTRSRRKKFTPRGPK
jgi:hypothetical protein